MLDPIYLPVTDTAEIRKLLKDFPLVVDQQRFLDFSLGFPRRYLVQTPKLEIVKHYLLAEGLGQKKVITSVAREDLDWRLTVLTRDRSGLFSLISGALSCWGMHIMTAEAFANAHAVALDTLIFRDPRGQFEKPDERRLFQAMLEDVVSGTKALEPILEQRWPAVAAWTPQALDVAFDNTAYSRGSLMSLHCRDRFGLLYLVSRHLAARGISIEMAFIRTREEEAEDEFYLTRGGRQLSAEEIAELQREFAAFPMPQFGKS